MHTQLPWKLPGPTSTCVRRRRRAAPAWQTKAPAEAMESAALFVCAVKDSAMPGSTARSSAASCLVRSYNMTRVIQEHDTHVAYSIQHYNIGGNGLSLHAELQSLNRAAVHTRASGQGVYHSRTLSGTASASQYSPRMRCMATRSAAVGKAKPEHRSAKRPRGFYQDRAVTFRGPAIRRGEICEFPLLLGHPGDVRQHDGPFDFARREHAAHVH
jgi:hypothetical protein